jgi:oligopeptide/dipeptide ABC transporter ATP-binding protein
VSPPALLQVQDLHAHLVARWGTVRAVDGVSFELRQGETLGIVGESGSGKSMTALSLLRLLPRPAGRIVGGRILLQGEDIAQKSEAEMRHLRGRAISMILQDPQTSLNPVFSIGDQLAEAIAMRYPGPRRTLLARAVEALRRVRVAAPEERVAAYPHQMSGGMKQRVVGAMALACEPKVVIADEPTTSLDVTIQAQYLRLLQELQKESGLSILFITHDFGVVAEMCDRVLVMYAGRIVERGPAEAIFDRPGHPYTRALLDSVPKLERKVDRLYAISGQPPALFDLPPGCRFAPRCPFADDRCRAEYPPAFALGEEHEASCWRLEDPAWQPTTSSTQRD